MATANYITGMSDTSGTTHYLNEGVDTRIFRATCSTAAGTAAKVATLDDSTNYSLTTGVRVAVTFTYGNSAATPTLKVTHGSDAAKTIATPTAAATLLTANGTTFNTWGPYETVIFTYNGTYWVKGATGLSVYNAYDRVNSISLQKLGQGYGVCQNDGSSATLTVSMTDFALKTGGLVTVKFSAQVILNSTLNVNSTGAKNIKFQGSNITDGVIIGGDICLFVYDGSAYDLLAIDRTIQASIVPADYVVAQGLNLNGGLNGYTKWNSGKLEVWQRITTTVNITSTYGNLYYGSITGYDYQLTPSVPAFIEYPTVTITAQGAAGKAIVAPNYDNYSATNTGTIYVYNPASSANTSVTINIHAVGRWK